MAEWNLGLKQTCAKRGLGFLSTSTDVSFESVITDLLRRGGLVT
jgi:hypothetical protein